MLVVKIAGKAAEEMEEKKVFARFLANGEGGGGRCIVSHGIATFAVEVLSQ